MNVISPRPFERGKRGNYDTRRDEILRVAARVFGERGFRQATLEDVAGAMNITRPALYHYARSKDELIAACAERARDELSQAVADAQRQPNGRQQLMAFFRRYVEVTCNEFGRCFVLVNPRELSEADQVINRAIQRELDEAVRAMVAGGVKDGSLRMVDAGDVSRLLFGAFNGVALWFRSNGPRTPGQIADDLLQIVLSGLDPQAA